MADKIMLIDGNSIINRAFHALPLLTNSNGEYTNAVYGFLNIFFKYYEEEKPDYIGVAFDLPKPTFRHIKYKDYKGTRKKQADELIPQIPLLKKILSKMNIKTYELEGYEADDILGTLCAESVKLNIQPVVISGDRDLLQLASDFIKIRIPKTKGGKTETEDYYENDVIQKYGVTPKEFIDLKALMGDKSDNVEGVPGIGEVTASKIIKEFKSVENAVENYKLIKPARASENLNKYREQAFLSKFLVTIKLDIPIEFNINDTKADNIFNEQAYNIFKENEFKSFLNKFEIITSSPEITKDNEYIYINSREKAEEFFYNLNPWEEVSYKIISENNNIIGLAITTEDNNGVFISAIEGMNEKTLVEISKRFFEGENNKITHDAKKDIVILNKYNIKINNLCFDTIIAGYILSSNDKTYDYNDIALEFLNENYESEEEILGKGKSKISLLDIEKEKLMNYSCRQSYISYKAKNVMAEKIEKNGQNELYYNIELPLIYVLAEMELNGIKIDSDKLKEYGIELKTKIDEITKEIYNMAGEEFNINSSKQMSNILFEKLGLSGGKKTKTGWSTSADVLEKLKNEHEIINKIINYRTYAKLNSTYVEGLLNVIDKKTNKIYSTFNQTITSTGRISSTEPNLQNIPIKIELGHRLRKVFIPSDEQHIFIDGDYSQIELRVLAHMADDKTLINAFIQGQDIHRLTASQVFDIPFDEVTQQQRSNAKAVNFGIVYGIGAFSLSQDLNITKKEAEDYINGYFRKYPNVKKYMDYTVNHAKENGYAKTIFNRIRMIPEINSNNFNIRAFGERIAMNMPVQGSAADIIKIAMIKVYKRLKEECKNSKLILQVHDELLIEAHKDEADTVKKILKYEMENAVKLKVPLDVDIHEGKNWYDAK